MTTKKRQLFPTEFKKEAVALVTEQGYTIAKAAQAVSTTDGGDYPPKGLMHHSDRGSQYASNRYQDLLMQHGMVCSISRKGNCWDNAPTERFFSSLKREWLTGNIYATHDLATADVRSYVSYYNSRRLHTMAGDMTPIEFEKSS